MKLHAAQAVLARRAHGSLSYIEALDRRSYEPADIEAAITFIQKHPCSPTWPEDLVRRFLTNLITSTDCVFDFYRNDQRIALGVLVDKIQNKGNHAILEILGLVSDADRETVFTAMLKEAQKSLIPERAGIEMTFDKSFVNQKTFAAATQLLSYYNTYMMINDNLSAAPIAARWNIITATPDDNPALYEVMVASFQDNLDTSIAPYEEWSKIPRPEMWLVKHNEKIVGFTHCPIADGAGEIRTVGVLPEMRGQGIAHDLMAHALQHLRHLGINQCHLTVSTTNQNAFKLYQRLGFHETDRHSAYVWKR